MYDISQKALYLYPVHRASVSGECSRADGPLVFFDRVETFWEKEKMLVISIFSFPHNVFKSCPPQGHYSWDCVVKG